MCYGGLGREESEWNLYSSGIIGALSTNLGRELGGLDVTKWCQ